MSVSAGKLHSVVRDLRQLLDRADLFLGRVHRDMDAKSTERVDAERQMETVISVVARRHGVPERLVYSRDRHETVVRVRQICMAIGHDRLTLSQRAIGKLFRRSPLTVAFALKTIRNLRETDPRFLASYNAVVAGVDKQLGS